MGTYMPWSEWVCCVCVCTSEDHSRESVCSWDPAQRVGLTQQALYLLKYLAGQLWQNFLFWALWIRTGRIRDLGIFMCKVFVPYGKQNRDRGKFVRIIKVLHCSTMFKKQNFYLYLCVRSATWFQECFCGIDFIVAERREYSPSWEVCLRHS